MIVQFKDVASGARAIVLPFNQFLRAGSIVKNCDHGEHSVGYLQRDIHRGWGRAFLASFREPEI